MSLSHKFKKYTYWKVNVRTMCGDIVYGIRDYERDLSQAMTSASLAPHTYAPCVVCWTPEEIKQIDKARERFPRFEYKPKPKPNLTKGGFYDVNSLYPREFTYPTFMQTCLTCGHQDLPGLLLDHIITKHSPRKENTMNTYTITTEGLHEHKIQGTTHTVTTEGLWIQDGVKPVAFFKHYDRFTIERDTGKGYVDTDSMHNTCPGMIYFEKMHTRYACGLPEGHTESHRHIQDGIVWL